MEIGEPQAHLDAGKRRRTWIRIRLIDSRGDAWRDVACDLRLPDGTTRRVKTDPDGRISADDISYSGVCGLVLPEHPALRLLATSEPEGGIVARPTTHALLATEHTHELRPCWPALHFDAHMHIMSGNCTPLPPLYGRLTEAKNLLRGFGKAHAKRGTINSFARTWLARLVSSIGDLSWRSTLDIGGHTAKLNDGLPTVYAQFASTRGLLAAGSGRLGVSIVLPMDMEYCHVDGYWGEPIYLQDLRGRWFYYERKTGTQPRKQRGRHYLDAGEVGGLEHPDRLSPSLRDKVVRWILARLSGSSLPEDPPPLADLPLDVAKAAVRALVTGILSTMATALLSDVREAFWRYLEGELLQDLWAGARSELMEFLVRSMDDALPEYTVGAMAIHLEDIVKLAEYVRGTIEDDEHSVVGHVLLDLAKSAGLYVLQWLIGHVFPSELYESWKQQCMMTERVAIEAPLQMLPMYHYEPRRYIRADLQRHLDDYKPPEPESWEAPFMRIVGYEPRDPTKKLNRAKQLYLGMKMYTSLGYRPTDYARVEQMKHMADFYATCQRADIPIMTHCTPGGFFTHQRRFYYDQEEGERGDEERAAYTLENYRKGGCTVCKDNDDRGDQLEKARQQARKGPVAAIRRLLSPAVTQDERRRMKFFQEKYQHPFAWRALLADYPDLRICLAHFASNAAFWAEETWTPKGPSHHDHIHYDVNWITEITHLCDKYPNFYTDISYLELLHRKFADNFVLVLKDRPWMLDKIMFGTDWYMFLNDRVRYSSWFSKTIAVLERVEAELIGPNFRPGLNLFHQFAVVNPIRFYRLAERGAALADNYRAAVEAAFEGPKLRAKRERLLAQLEHRAAAFAPLPSLMGPLLGDSGEPRGIPSLVFTTYPAAVKDEHGTTL